MALACEKGLLHGLCKGTVIEQCTYCGRHFCLKHGHLDKAVCNSSTCMRKYKHDRAIADRTAWEEEQHLFGIEKNAVGLCGFGDCPNEIYVACGHCEVRFCPEHVTRHTFTYTTYTRRDHVRIKGDITLCDVCLPHLKEYKRDRYE